MNAWKSQKYQTPIGESPQQVIDRCGKMTKAKLMGEIVKISDIAQKLFMSSTETCEIANKMEAEIHCLKGMKGEIKAVANTLRSIADEGAPASFLIHLAEYLDLISS